jgi:hypothetical protein
MITDRLAAGTVAFGKADHDQDRSVRGHVLQLTIRQLTRSSPHFSNTGAATGNETTGDIRFLAHPWRTLLVSYSSAKRSIQTGCTSST